MTPTATQPRPRCRCCRLCQAAAMAQPLAPQRRLCRRNSRNFAPRPATGLRSRPLSLQSMDQAA
eukprot:365993-Chlamydomonas_euryale.AAC.6